MHSPRGGGGPRGSGVFPHTPLLSLFLYMFICMYICMYIYQRFVTLQNVTKYNVICLEGEEGIFSPFRQNLLEIPLYPESQRRTVHA